MFSKLVATATLLFGVGLATVAVGDSPITSTNFYTAYLEECRAIPTDENRVLCNMLQRAEELNDMDDVLLAYLADPETSTIAKALVVNAISWGGGAPGKAEIFLEHVSGPLVSLTSDDYLVYGYLKVMGDYFYPEAALADVLLAHHMNPESFTVAVVRSLVEAQVLLHRGPWPRVWQVYADVLSAYAPEDRDMDSAAVAIITRYMVLYRE